MHILTGLLVGEFLLGGGILKKMRGGSGGGGGRGGPGFKLKHVVSGRVRFLVPLLKDGTKGSKTSMGADARREGLVAELQEIRNVKQVLADRRTGSVVVKFQEAQATRRDIVACLQRFVEKHRVKGETQEGQEMSTVQGRLEGEPLLKETLMEAGRALNAAVSQETRGVVDLHTLLASGLGVLGVKTLVAPGDSRRLSGLSWLYWSYNLLRRPSPKPPEEVPPRAGGRR